MTRHLHAVSYLPTPVADDLAAQHDALNNPEPCPICAATTGNGCTNPTTGQPLHYGRVTHWQRIPRPPQATDTPTAHGGTQ